MIWLDFRMGRCVPPWFHRGLPIGMLPLRVGDFARASSMPSFLFAAIYFPATPANRAALWTTRRPVLPRPKLARPSTQAYCVRDFAREVVRDDKKSVHCSSQAKTATAAKASAHLDTSKRTITRDTEPVPRTASKEGALTHLCPEKAGQKLQIYRPPKPRIHRIRPNKRQHRVRRVQIDKMAPIAAESNANRGL